MTVKKEWEFDTRVIQMGLLMIGQNNPIAKAVSTFLADNMKVRKWRITVEEIELATVEVNPK